MRIIEDTKLDFDSVLIVPKRSTLKSRAEVSITRSFTFKYSGLKWEGIPIIASNMDGVGTIDMYNTLSQLQLMTALHKHHTEQQLVEFYSGVGNSKFVWYSTGIGQKDLDKLDAVINKIREKHNEDYVNFICVDVANGYTEVFVDAITSIREKYPNKIIMAGNVVTPEMTEELILAGVDIVKVGIGSGSVCTTRIVAGVGYPQLSAIIECADAAHGLGGLICSDGGCTTPADVAKAFAGGADFVMLGSMFAGHDEGGGVIVDNMVEFYGMSSSTAMNKHNGGVAEYRSSEGRTVKIPYRGPVKDTVNYILGGIRSACTYTGSRKLKELSKRTTFVKVNNTHNRIYENVTTKIR